MKITILCIGKLREDWLKKGIGEYLKRIERFVNIELKEAESFTDIGEKYDYTILLDEHGKELTSQEFSNLLKKLQMTKRNACFMIGGWEGMDDVLKRKADYLLSLSKMTFPYQLVRIIFLEQLYRAFTIIKGINYHK